MSTRIIGCRVFNLKGFLYNYSIQKSVRTITTDVSSYLSSTHVSKFMVPPPSLEFSDTLKMKIDALQMLTPRPQILDKPIVNVYKIDLPMTKMNIRYEDIAPTTEIQDPKPSNNEEKHAIRMIVIRKRKMRIHKLKKLRKRMKHVYAKIKLKRRSEKEKAFQAMLMAQIKEAKRFDPAIYVKEKIAKSNEVLIPKLWRGKRLPEFIIKDLIDRRKKTVQEIEERTKRRNNMNLNAADYK